MPKRQAKEWAAKVSPDFEALYQHRASHKDEQLRVNLDALGLNRRQEILTEPGALPFVPLERGSQII